MVGDPLYVWTDGNDWVIARNAQHGHDIAHESWGASPGDMGEVEDWRLVSSNKVVRVYDDNLDQWQHRTAAEWVIVEGKAGLLASTEW